MGAGLAEEIVSTHLHPSVATTPRSTKQRDRTLRVSELLEGDRELSVEEQVGDVRGKTLLPA
jgi:hypothetical protein